MTDETENKSHFAQGIEGMDDEHFSQVTKMVEAEQRRRGEAGDDFDAAEVGRMSGTDFEAWQRKQGEEYQRRIADMSPAELADYKRGKR